YHQLSTGSTLPLNPMRFVRLGVTGWRAHQTHKEINHAHDHRRDPYLHDYESILRGYTLLQPHHLRQEVRVRSGPGRAVEWRAQGYVGLLHQSYDARLAV